MRVFRVRKVSYFLAALLLAATSNVSIAQAQQQTSQRQFSFDIPPQPVTKGVNDIGRIAGLSVVFSENRAINAVGRPVRGTLTAQAALSMLLSGTGLTYRFSNASTVQIFYPSANATDDTAASAEGTTVLGTIMVQGENAWGPVQGVVAKRSGTATKTDTAIEKIPQTVNVVTAEEVTARGAVTVSQALRYTPGINVNGFTDANKIADEVTARSFAPAPIYLDGAYLPYAGSLGGSLQIDPYWLERIEVLKGPSSVLYGQNQPGGIINLVTKKPLDTPYREVRIGYDSNNQKEVGVDLSGPVNDEKTILYRFTGLVKGGQEQIDFTKSKRVFLAPSIALKPNEGTSLTLYGSYQHDGGVPDYQPLPYIGTAVAGPDGKYISRDLFTGEPGWNDFKRDQYILGADFEHAFNDNVKFRSSVRYVDVKDDYKGFYLRYFVINPDESSDYSKAVRNKLNWAQHNSVISIDNNLEVEYDTGSVQHTSLFGIDYRRFSRKYDGYNDYSADPIDLYNPVYGGATADPDLTTRWDNTLDQVGVYAQDQMEWDRFVLTVGGRYDWARLNNRTLPIAAGDLTTVDKQNDGAFTGRIGITYLFDNGIAPYASYSESFLPQLGTTFEGKSYEPLTGKQYEIGVKYKPQGMNALFTLSAFQITQENALTDDYVNVGYSLQQGETRARGIEFEAKAEVLSGWNAIGGISYTDAEYVNDSYYQGLKTTGHAPWAASLWTSYDIQSGVFDGLNIGTGVRYTGPKFIDGYNTLKIKGFSVVDAALSYDLGKLRPQMSGVKASLNVENLFDKTYLSDCGYAFGCSYGKARTIAGGISYKF